jgi:hypothetical protein
VVTKGSAWFSRRIRHDHHRIMLACLVWIWSGCIHLYIDCRRQTLGYTNLIAMTGYAVCQNVSPVALHPRQVHGFSARRVAVTFAHAYTHTLTSHTRVYALPLFHCTGHCGPFADHSKLGRAPMKSHAVLICCLTHCCTAAVLPRPCMSHMAALCRCGKRAANVL